MAKLFLFKTNIENLIVKSGELVLLFLGILWWKTELVEHNVNHRRLVAPSIGENGLVVMTGGESVELYQIH